MVFLVVELLCFVTFANRPRKDSLMTKTYVLTVTALILVTIITAYNFVCKPEAPYLRNGGATLWDTQTEELADEICASCDTDAEKVQAIYSFCVTIRRHFAAFQCFLMWILF